MDTGCDFPRTFIFKTLGVENLGNVSVLDQNEPLLLDGLGRYTIRHFTAKRTAGTA